MRGAAVTINIARGTTDPEIDSETWTELGNNMAPLTLITTIGHQMAPLDFFSLDYFFH